MCHQIMKPEETPAEILRLHVSFPFHFLLLDLPVLPYLQWKTMNSYITQITRLILLRVHISNFHFQLFLRILSNLSSRRFSDDFKGVKVNPFEYIHLNTSSHQIWTRSLSSPILRATSTLIIPVFEFLIAIWWSFNKT